MIQTFYIYTLSHPLTDEVRYVGKTNDMKMRFAQHLSDRRRTHRRYWIDKLRSQSLKPKMELLESITSEHEEDWQDAERFWIETLKFIGVDLINKESGGRGGKRMHPETKKKLSQKLAGHPVSPESRAKMSISHLGHKRTRESVEKTARSVRGVPLTPEHRAKISKAHTGVKLSAERIAKMSLARKGIKMKPEVRERLNALRSTPEFRARVTGWKHTPETRARLSALHKARFRKMKQRTNLQLAFEL